MLLLQPGKSQDGAVGNDQSDGAHTHAHTLNSVRALRYADDQQGVKMERQPIRTENRWSAYSRQPVRKAALAPRRWGI